MADIYELAVENGYLAAAVMELQDSTRTEYDKKLGWCYLRSDYSGRDWMEPIPLAYINDSEQDGLITDLLDWDCTPEDYDWDGEDIDDVKEWLYENLFDMILDKLSGQKANESCNEGFDMLSDMEKWLKELLDDGVKMTKFSAAQRLASHFPGASESDIQKVVKKMKLKESKSKGKGMIDVLGGLKESQYSSSEEKYVDQLTNSIWNLIPRDPQDDKGEFDWVMEHILSDHDDMPEEKEDLKKILSKHTLKTIIHFAMLLENKFGYSFIWDDESERYGMNESEEYNAGDIVEVQDKYSPSKYVGPYKVIRKMDKEHSIELYGNNVTGYELEYVRDGSIFKGDKTTSNDYRMRRVKESVNESRELDRKLFVSLVAYGDKPYEGYGVLNDGYFVKKIYADSDEEAISKFRSWLSNPDDE